MAKQTKSTTGKSIILVVLMLCLAGSILALDESGTNEKSEQTEQPKEESAAFLAAKLRAEERAQKTESETSWPYKSPPVERRRGESEASYKARCIAAERVQKGVADPRNVSETYSLEVKTIVSENIVVVKQFIITTQRETRVHLSAGSGSGGIIMRPKSGTECGQASATLTILASITPERMGSYRTHLFKFESDPYASGGVSHGRNSSQTYSNIEELLLLTAKPGTYRFGEPLSLGVFEGKPIVLLVMVL